MQLDIASLLQKPSDRVWDRYVPILAQEQVIRAYLTDDIAGPDEYNELCDMIRSADRHQTVELYINNPGGQIDSALMILDAIKASKAKVVGHLSGSVASAATIIALGCDKLEVPDTVIFMVHNYSAGSSGKGKELKTRQEFMDKHLSTIFTNFYKGFLTDEEIDDVINDNDIWLSGIEVRERVKAREQYRKEAKNV